MLQLILGRSGFGKTHTVIAELAATVKTEPLAAERCILIVPEQASFETERMLVRALGEHDAAKVQVLSFTRLCETLMKSRTARPLSNGAKIMLMSRALEQQADRLEVFGGVKRVDTVESLLELAAECRQSAVSPAVLQAAADQLPDGTLRRKTAELALVLETYEAFAASCGSDPQEMLTQLAAWLHESRALANTLVYVDGFKGFTAPEIQVLESIMAQAERVTVTLCTDKEYDETKGMDRFFVVVNTVERLKRAAADVGCAVAKSRLLMTPYRFENETLAALEATAFTPEEWETAPSDAVTLTACGDIYEEAAYVVQTVRRLMRTEGLRARDVAVVARNASEYIGVLDAAFERADIQFYLDRRSTIVSESAVVCVLTALKIAVDGWRTESLLRLMKTGLLGFSVSSVAKLENYVFTWNITGGQFKSLWQAHPRGFASSLEPSDEAALSHLNRMRRRLVKPLEELADALASPLTGMAFAKAVYRYIRRARIDRMLIHTVKRLRVGGEETLASHLLQVWEAFVGVLDDMASVLGDETLSAAAAVDLLRAAAVKTEVGSIPQSLDAVQIGAADRMRFAAPRIVFVLGANEGVFPALPPTQGVLSDRERRRLMENGVPFEDDRAHHTAAEQFLAYTALSAASSRVFISYLLNTPDGERGEPSSLVRTVTAHLPFVGAQPARRDDGADIETVEEAFERMAYGFRAKTPLSRALYDLLWQDERHRPRLRAMTRMAEELPVAFEDSEAAKRFFGDRMVLSPSRVERYHQCRFAYFCQYGLKALPRRAAELGAIEFGTLTHYVMENTLPVYIEEGVKTIRKARCFEDAKAASLRFVEEEMGGIADKPPRFSYLLGRLQGVCGNFLWQAVRELSQSHFVPADYELDISLSSDDERAVRPMTFTLPDGASVAMIGKVDRVDIYDDGHRRYVRVIDYKTGSKQFRLEDVVEGINLQMLIYMMTLWKNGAPRYGDVLPAGLLYMPSKAPSVKVEELLSDEELEKQQTKQMRMNGLLLSDEQVLAAMEPAIAGVFIPATLKKDGTFSAASSVASLEQFGALGRRAQKLLEDMAKTLRSGDIDTAPFITKKNDPCQYCDYRAVCGHEEGDRVREPSYDSAAKVLEALSEEENS